MTDASETLSLVEEQAYRLSRAALAIDQLRAASGPQAPGMAEVLHDNLMVWIALRTVVQHPDCMLLPEAKRNLIDLSNFMADKTFDPASLTPKTLDMIININLQICEGLLEGEKRNQLS